MSKGAGLLIAVVAIALGVTLAYQSAVFSSRSGDDAPVYSARRHDPYGTAALMDLLVERGSTVRSLERPSLEADDHGVLIQVLPLEQSRRSRGGFHLQTQQLADWIARGNTVVQLTRAPTDLMRHFKLTSTTQPSAKDVESIEDSEISGDMPAKVPGSVYLARIEVPQDEDEAMALLRDKRLTLRAPMEFAEQKQSKLHALARLPTKHGAMVAAEFRVGQGNLVLIGAPTPALNGTLGDEANLDFLLALIGKQPVIFDEWSHGVGHEATIMGFIHDVGLLPVLVQIALIALLYVWSTSGHAQRDDDEVPRHRSSIEQIETLGFLYSRSLSKEVAYDRVKTEVRRRLCDALRCKAEEVNARATQLRPETAAKVAELFSRLQTVEPVHRARCLRCGYDLTLNRSGRCPECGEEITGELRARIAEAGSGSKADPDQKRTRHDSVLADVLTLSHQLSQEIHRERRAIR